MAWSRLSMIAMALVLAGLNPVSGRAEDAAAAPDPFVCAPVPAPITSLDHGSRYSAADKSRSDFDEQSNKEVEAQLKPIDDFIVDLALAANRAVAEPPDRKAAATCVLDGLLVWAKADALSDLATMNAQLSAPSRLAGLAFAYAQVQPFLLWGEDQVLVEAWLGRRAKATMVYFDTEAPPNASRNNLRAWAGLAVARVGLVLQDEGMLDWADASFRLVACQAVADGSLPLEMARKDLALHYQLHAITPLVVTAALLQSDGRDLFSACDGAIHRAVGFAVAAFQDPGAVTRLAGRQQTYFAGKETLRGFELAWAEVYLSRFPSPGLAALVAEFLPLSNSKLGGRQSLLWPLMESDPAP